MTNDVETEPDAARFDRLPVQRRLAVESKWRYAADVEPTEPSRRFLVLDTYEDFRTALCAALRMRGHVADALDPRDELPPLDHDIVLVEISSETSRLVTHTRLHAPSAIVVAMLTHEEGASGVDATIRKPFTIEELFLLLVPTVHDNS